MSERMTLPARRRAETRTLRHPKLGEFVVTIGYYRDGRPGEVFISGAKAGSEIDAVTRDGAVLVSLALQHDTPLLVMQHAITRESDGGASSIIGMTIDLMVEEQRGH